MFLPVVLFAQNASETVLNRMKELPIHLSDLNFTFMGVDTVVGIEVNYFYKSDDKCNTHLFFISDTSSTRLHDNITLKEYLSSAGSNYHYMMYDNYSWFFGSEYNDVDSFRVFNNEQFYRAVLDPDMKKAHYYNVGKEEFYSVAKVKVVVYKFYSTDIKHSKYFYHFDDNYDDRIEKLIYKNVLNREYIKQESLLLGTTYNGDVDCNSVYR